jgi:hypothetical protein
MHNAIFNVTLGGWNIIGSIKGEESLWNYEYVINNLILHLWTCTKLVVIGPKVTNSYVTKNMLLKTLEDFYSPSLFERFNLFFRFNKHKHHIVHVMQTCWISTSLTFSIARNHHAFKTCHVQRKMGMFSDITQIFLSMHMQITPTINICYTNKNIVTFMRMNFFWK